MKVLISEGIEFVDRESWLEQVQAKEALMDELEVERAKYRAAKRVIDNWIEYIATKENRVAVSDEAYGHFDKLHMGTGGGIMLETLRETRSRLNRAYLRIMERRDHGVTLDWEGDDYGISN